VVVDHVGLGKKNQRAGEDQKQFSRQPVQILGNDDKKISLIQEEIIRGD
jgi:hypothetical protein